MTTKANSVVQLVPFADQQHLAEIYGSGFQFAMIGPNLEIACPWVYCKDFLNDAVWAHLHGSSASIYGFKYDSKKHPALQLDPVLMAVRNRSVTNEQFDKQIQQSIKFLNIVERRMGFVESKLEKANDGTKHSVWMLTSPKEWVHAPAMLSLYTLFVRVGCHYKGGGHLNAALKDFKQNVKHNDANYLKRSRKLRLLIMKYGIQIFAKKIEDNYPKNIDVHTMHNASGIVNSAGCATFTKLWDLSQIENVGKKEDEEMGDDDATPPPAEVAVKKTKVKKKKASKKASKKK